MIELYGDYLTGGKLRELSNLVFSPNFILSYLNERSVEFEKDFIIVALSALLEYSKLENGSVDKLVNGNVDHRIGIPYFWNAGSQDKLVYAANKVGNYIVNEYVEKSLENPKLKLEIDKRLVLLNYFKL